MGFTSAAILLLCAAARRQSRRCRGTAGSFFGVRQPCCRFLRALWRPGGIYPGPAGSPALCLWGSELQLRHSATNKIPHLQRLPAQLPGSAPPTKVSSRATRGISFFFDFFLLVTRHSSLTTAVLRSKRSISHELQKSSCRSPISQTIQMES